MANIPGSVRLTGFIAPTDSTDTFPVTDPTWGLGGLRRVSGTTERDLISTGRRESGMLVYSESDDNYYKLGSGLTNSDWSIFMGAGGTGDFLSLSGGTVTGITEFTSGLISNTLSGGTFYSGGTDLYNIFGAGGEETLAQTLAFGNTSGAFDISLDSGQVLKSSSGGSELDLRAFGADNYFLLGSNPNNSLEGGSVFGQPNYAGVYYSDAAQTDYSYVESADEWSVLRNYRNGRDNSIWMRNGSGATIDDNKVELLSVTGSITLSAGTGDIYFLNSIATDNALTNVLSRDPSDGKIREVSISSFSSSITASNGLTKIGDNITLGGALTGNTSISIGGNVLSFSGGDTIFTHSVSADTLSLTTTTSAPINMNSMNLASPADGSMWFSTSGSTTLLHYRVSGVTKSVELT